MAHPPLPARLEGALATWPRWSVCPGAPPSVERALAGGLSNSSWLLNTGRGRAVLRLNATGDACFNIDRERERQILHCLRGQPFAPEVWHCDPAAGILVTGFVAGQVLSGQSVADAGTRRRVCELLHNLGAFAPPLPRFDYLGHLHHYLAQVALRALEIPDHLAALLSSSEQSLRDFQQADWTPALTHHDLNPANLIDTGDRLVLIDWEYAAMGYAGMDRAPWCDDHDPFAAAVAAYRQLIDGLWCLLADCQPTRDGGD